MNYRYFLRLSFNGESFHGWQSQHNAHKYPIDLERCDDCDPKGTCRNHRRTAGQMPVYMHLSSMLTLIFKWNYLRYERKELVYHLNGYLPDAISVSEIIPVKKNAHSRFSAISRTYQYIITRKKDPFRQAFSWYYPGRLNSGLMNKGAEVIKNNPDFTSFAKLPKETKTNICHVEYAKWEEKGDLLVFTITADRFLRNMVRAIVGTLIELGRGKINLEDLDKIILSRDRGAAGYSVPANGLFLVSVNYPEEIFLKTVMIQKIPTPTARIPPPRLNPNKKFDFFFMDDL